MGSQLSIPMANPRPSVLLPRPVHLRAAGIALYNDGGEFSLDVDHDLFAIVGANGLGKTTLLNLFLYGLTGAVKRAGLKVDVEADARGFLAQAVENAVLYFEGRVRRDTKTAPYVELTFELGKHTVKVRRAFFKTSSVTQFSVNGKNHSLDPDPETAYRNAVCELSKLVSFEQFAFLVFTVQYFGEDHFCLFWDQLALNQVIATIVAGNAEEGSMMGTLLAEYSRHDSLMRNAQWQISKAKDLLKQLSDSTTGKKIPARIVDRYSEATSQAELLRGRLSALMEEQSEATAHRDEAQIAVEDARRTTEAATWTALSQRKLPLAKSPLLTQFSSELVCPVCRTVHRELPQTVSDAIDSKACPLCASDTSPKGSGAALEEKLKGLRQQKRRAEEQLSRAQDELDSHLKSTEECRRSLRDLERTLLRLESDYEREALAAAAQLRATGLPTDKLTSVRTQIDALSITKADHKARRDAAHKKLTSVQQRLMAGFQSVRGDLVPRFQKLAREFLGVPLNLSAKTARKDQVPIVDVHISIDNSERRRAEQLSESQRYFLDIALRMTLLSWVAKDQWTPFLAIDTPEGALDIAYETNAGTMFAHFLRDHDGAMLTASNINSSQLLRKTLEICHKSELEIGLLDLREYAHTTAVQERHKDILDHQIDDLKKIAAGEANSSAGEAPSA